MSHYLWTLGGAVAGGLCGLWSVVFAQIVTRRLMPEAGGNLRRTRIEQGVCGVVLAGFGAWLLWRASATGGGGMGSAFCDLVAAGALAVVAVVNARTFCLPNIVTVGGAAALVATAYFRPVGLQASVVGAAGAYAVGFVGLNRVLGGGTVKLLAFVGAWLGAWPLLCVLFISMVAGLAWTAISKVLGVSLVAPAPVLGDIALLRTLAANGDRDAAAALAGDPLAAQAADRDVLPTGPMIFVGSLLFVVFGERILGLFKR